MIQEVTLSLFGIYIFLNLFIKQMLHFMTTKYLN